MPAPPQCLVRPGTLPPEPPALPKDHVPRQLVLLVELLHRLVVVVGMITVIAAGRNILIILTLLNLGSEVLYTIT